MSMSYLRHDARQCREHAKSELIRHSFGFLTPEEQAKAAKAEEKREKKAKKKDAKGILLPLDEQD
jgi:hypothetical protein